MGRKRRKEVSKRSSRLSLISSLYEKRARRWGEVYLSRNLWRIKGMYSHEDVKQEAFTTFLIVYRKHPGKSEDELFRLYKARFRGRLINWSKQCFPNSYAYMEKVGPLVVDLVGPGGEINPEVEAGPFSVLPEAAVCLELLDRLPKELHDAMRLLIRDFFGDPCITQLRARKTTRGLRLEPIEKAIARQLGIENSRDVVAEIAKALNIEYGGNTDA